LFIYAILCIDIISRLGGYFSPTEGLADYPAHGFSQLSGRHVGPGTAEILIAQDDRSWIMPTFLRGQEEAAICRVVAEPEP
jgi:hypothetical protein